MTSRNSLLRKIISYQTRSVGIDMVLKCLLNIFRLLAYYSTGLEEQKRYYSVVDAILEARMLGNFGKPTLTFYQAVNKYGSFLETNNKLRRGSRLSSLCATACLASALLRTLEQFFGDLGFLQKVVVHHWSRQTFSFYFAFFKSFSILLMLLAETIKYFGLRKSLAEVGPCRRGHCHNLGSIRAELQRSTAIIIRSICDMYVYCKWIPSYTPNPVLAYLCGFTSGLLGVWLVWKENGHPTGCIEEYPCERGKALQ